MDEYADFWTEVQHFTKGEFNRNNLALTQFEMDRDLIVTLDAIRSDIDPVCRILVNVGAAMDGHSTNSLHYPLSERGGIVHAADIVIVRVDTSGTYRRVNVLHQAMTIMASLNDRRRQLSIGMYPHWGRMLNGAWTLTGGLHVDTRDKIGRQNICWWKDRVKADGHHQYHYYPLSDWMRACRELHMYMTDNDLHV